VVPVAYRGQLGQDIFEWLGEVASVPTDRLRWRFRMLALTEPCVLFGAAPRHDELVRAGFESYVRLRHQQRIELLENDGSSMTVGVLLTPRRDGVRPWDTTVLATRGEQNFDPRYRLALEKLWGNLGDSRTSAEVDRDPAIVAGVESRVGGLA
jgi:hypothetical protein